MKNVLLSAIMTVCGLGYSYAHVGLNRSVLGIEGVAQKKILIRLLLFQKLQPSNRV